MALFIGYLASAFLAVSLIVSSAFKFRWYSLAGQVTFIVYGLMINAMPVVIANGILLVINVYQIIQLYRIREAFDLVPVSPTDELVTCFINRNRKDVDSYFPSFTVQGQNIRAYITLRDLTIANLFIINLNKDGEALVLMNYTIPKYRDYKVGKFLFEEEKRILLSEGVKRISYAEVTHLGHKKFLARLGFSQTQDGQFYKFLN